jgi:hypothetical protein
MSQKSGMKEQWNIYTSLSGDLLKRIYYDT